VPALQMVSIFLVSESAYSGTIFAEFISCVAGGAPRLAQIAERTLLSAEAADRPPSFKK
jgi:hypothetical protein